MFPAHARAQRIEVYAGAGLAVSTALVRDLLADATIPAAIGAPVREDVRAVPAPGPELGAGVRVAFWPRVTLGLEGSWAATELEADDGAGRRPIQDVTVLQTTVSANWGVRRSMELGVGAGLIWYRADEQGLFAAGSDASPVVEVSAAWRPAFWAGRVSLVGAARTHRFGTPVHRAAGGQDGSVTRASLTARLRLLEAGR